MPTTLPSSAYCQFVISAFKENHLELKDIAILSVIHQDSNGYCNQNDIKDALNLEATHVSIGCAKLENIGLLERRTSPSDTRKILCLLTDEGKQFIKRHSDAANKFLDPTS